MVRSLEHMKPDVNASIRSIRDFPIPGINFRDIMPLFQKPALVNELCLSIAEHCKKLGNIQAVAGLEARGFLFGPQIAIALNVPFVPIRKKGKLPGEVVSASYIKEYGEDIVEIQKDAFPEGAKVFIVDDLLATGGTLKAAVDLIRKAGGDIAQAFVLIELLPLNGRSKVPDVDVFSLLSYNEA